VKGLIRVDVEGEGAFGYAEEISALPGGPFQTYREAFGTPEVFTVLVRVV
jgi:hypothetical protein